MGVRLPRNDLKAGGYPALSIATY